MKRAFDVTVASLGLVMTSPIIAVAAVAVKISSSGPAFYKGPRVGRGGRVFQIYKLRTMRINADGSGPAITSADDQRVTALGRLLRRSKADELPQLLNVIKGDMSLVGPRPEHPRYVNLYPPGQRDSLQVRPGMTGLSTLAFIDEEDILAGTDAEKTYVERVLPRKLELDRQYVRTATFFGDLAIILKTLRLVAIRPFKRGA